MTAQSRQDQSDESWLKHEGTFDLCHLRDIPRSQEGPGGGRVLTATLVGDCSFNVCTLREKEHFASNKQGALKTCNKCKDYP